jgi:hypothetical protein
MKTETNEALVRFSALIADAEVCMLDGPATEQAKCIAALAKALREERLRLEKATEALRGIAAIVRE